MRNLLLPFFLTLSIVPAATACDSFLDLGGNDDPPPATDPAQPPPGSSPGEGTSQSAASAALSTYCSRRTTYANKCQSEITSCEYTQGKECLAAYAIYRDEYTKALTTCSTGFSEVCGEHAETVEKYNCVIDEQDKVAPTSAMTALAADLCTACADPGGKACPGDKFFFHGKRTPNGITVSGQGAKFDMYTDAVVQKLRDACLAKAKGSSCWQSFYSCVDAEIAKLTPASVKSACPVNGTGDVVPPMPIDGGK